MLNFRPSHCHFARQFAEGTRSGGGDANQTASESGQVPVVTGAHQGTQKRNPAGSEDHQPDYGAILVGSEQRRVAGRIKPVVEDKRRAGDGTGPLVVDEYEAARRLDISVKTARNWRYKGIGPPFVKYGSGRSSPIRYPVRGLDEFIEANLRSSTSDTPRV
jgi:hypothetical protein